jgi:hypothetical protein
MKRKLGMSWENSPSQMNAAIPELDSEPIVISDMCLGQELAVSYDNVREHRRFD